MRIAILCILALGFMSSYGATFTLSRSVKNSVEFVSHEKPGQWSSYLAMNIFFPPVKSLFHDLDESLAGALNKKKARREAHITVITPVEFHDVLREKISIQEIHGIAREFDIQSADFKIICLGKGEAQSKGRFEQTYYIVVTSPKLLEIRKAIFELFKSRGGNISQFDPDLFYPHITVGYTAGDLHLGSHGVKKGQNSCFARVQLQN